MVEIEAIWCKDKTTQPTVIKIEANSKSLKSILISGAGDHQTLSYCIYGILIAKLYPCYSEILYHLDMKINPGEILDMDLISQLPFNRIVDTLVDVRLPVRGPFVILGTTSSDFPFISLPEYRQKFWLNRLSSNKLI